MLFGIHIFAFYITTIFKIIIMCFVLNMPHTVLHGKNFNVCMLTDIIIIALNILRLVH